MLFNFGLFATKQNLIFQFLNVQRLGQDKYLPPIRYWQRPAFFRTFFILLFQNLVGKKISELLSFNSTAALLKCGKNTENLDGGK